MRGDGAVATATSQRVIGEEWDTIEEYASKLDDLAFSKRAAVQRLTSKCMKEIGKDLSEQVVPVACSCLLYTSPSPRDGLLSRMPSSA